METKGITCKIPKELHDRISEEIRAQGSTMNKFIEAIINEHYEPKEVITMKQRTMAFQISEELFQKIKDYLARYEQVYGRRLTQREFVLGLIESALEDADEEFEAAEAARQGDEDAEVDAPADEIDELDELDGEDDAPAGDEDAAVDPEAGEDEAAEADSDDADPEDEQDAEE